MDGKVVVITGGTSGIGLAAAEQLAALGARLVLVGRDKSRTESALARLVKGNATPAHRAVYANLASMAEVRRAAAEIAAGEPRIDVLINNAGAMFSQRQLSPDGLEMTFALNHMSYFLMAEGLKERLVASKPARIVNTASGAHWGASLKLDDLQSARGYSGAIAYARSKLCNILFSRELARRLGASGVTANCLHPGFVASRFGDEAGGVVGALFPLFKLAAISPEEGAKTITYLSSSPQVAAISGGYFYRCAQKQPSDAARDDQTAAKLWAESERLAAAVA